MNAFEREGSHLLGSYSDPRPLPSFPTRRSSDLGSDSNTASIALGYAESVVRMHSVALRSEGQNRRAGVAAGTPAVEDRKSTRLNSSHPSSSYAVFRLKKKSWTVPCLMRTWSEFS